MRRVLMIGIDSLDPILLSKFENDLPNFSRLKRGSPNINMMSIYPIDSVPAWISIYTGLNPAKHGILDSIDYIRLREGKESRSIDVFRGKTFWDFIGAKGKKVCIINPFLAYPVWPVNGVMINGPHIGEGKIQCFPDSIMERYEIPYLGGIDYPLKHDLKFFYKEMKKLVISEFDFGLTVLKDDNWDLFFIYSTILDRIQHFYWRFSDKGDPTYPGDNSYESIIKDFYKLYDEIIGKFICECDSNRTIIIFSDHGMERRCIKLVNINEILRRKGLLIPKDRRKYKEIIKSKLVDFVYNHELEDQAIKLATVVLRTQSLNASSVIRSPKIYDPSKTVAHTSDFAGMMKSFGGINVLGKGKYEEIRNLVIEELAKITDPITGEKIARSIKKREYLYSGEYLHRYPDVLFELEPKYGISWDIFTPLITNNYAHRFCAGGHSINCVFLISNEDNREFKRKNLALMDIAPTVIDILNISGDYKFDGMSIFREDDQYDETGKCGQNQLGNHNSTIRYNRC